VRSVFEQWADAAFLRMLDTEGMEWRGMFRAFLRLSF
jgi:hypothetical protein